MIAKHYGKTYTVQKLREMCSAIFIISLTVVPNEDTKIVGKILLPPQGAGKVKEE
jgi:hypothetical protein